MKKVEFNPVRIQLSRLFMIPIVLFTFYSCSDSDSDVPNEVVPAPYRCITCKTVPEAKAENDNSYEGIYIAVNPNSSVVVDVMNGSDDLTAKMNIRGADVNFIAKDIILDGGIYMSRFEGIYHNQPVTFNFSVAPDGTNPKIASDDFPGFFPVSKETSTSMIEVFDGSWTVKEDPALSDPLARITDLDTINNDSDTAFEIGRFSMLVARSNANENAWWRGTNTLFNSTSYPAGLINSNQMFDNQKQLIGIMNVDELTGVYVDGTDQKVYLSTKRIL